MSNISNSFHRFMGNHLVQAVGAACFTAFVGLFAATLIGRLLFNNETAQLICGSIGATLLAAGAARQALNGGPWTIRIWVPFLTVASMIVASGLLLLDSMFPAWWLITAGWGLLLGMISATTGNG